jgi:tetratricopeptide (TPR) repeat protein
MKQMIVLLLLAGAAPALAQHEMPGPATAGSSIPPLSALGDIHHAVATRVPAAQTAFDQGLALCYGFNHDEAVRAFQRAATLDPNLAMAHWGIAYASGPNINLPMDPDHAKVALAEIQQAQALGENAPEPDKTWIDALAKRYSADSTVDRATLDAAYRGAMADVVAKYPDDPDAGALYAESILDLHPWHWWTLDGQPTEGTEEAIATLERVLKAHPSHIGANHFLIHALEESPHPERALPAARRLQAMTRLQAGHLVHMPSHIYERVGQHQLSATINDQAAGIDRRYITANHIEGIYPMMYYNHNMHFATFSYMNAGNYKNAMRAGGQLLESVRPAVKEMAMVEALAPMPLIVQVQFRRWGDILATPDPGEGFPLTRTFWHFARAMAYAGTGDVDRAGTELAAYRDAGKLVKPENWIGFNPLPVLYEVGAQQVQGAIAEAHGDRAGAVEHWRSAVAAEDSLQYDEPPEWPLYGRTSLGGVLLRDRQDAAAEQVFRDELKHHPGNGRAQFGLAEALRRQGRTAEAAKVEVEFHRNWSASDTRLTVATL